MYLSLQLQQHKQGRAQGTWKRVGILLGLTGVSSHTVASVAPGVVIVCGGECVLFKAVSTYVSRASTPTYSLTCLTLALRWRTTWRNDGTRGRSERFGVFWRILWPFLSDRRSLHRG